MAFIKHIALVSLLLSGSANAFAPSRYSTSTISKSWGDAALTTSSITGTSSAARTTFLRMSSSDSSTFDFDVAIIGCGVGGHGAALHSRGQSLKTAVFSGNDVGGTCVNRGW